GFQYAIVRQVRRSPQSRFDCMETTDAICFLCPARVKTVRIVPIGMHASYISTICQTCKLALTRQRLIAGDLEDKDASQEAIEGLDKATHSERRGRSGVCRAKEKASRSRSK